MKTPIILSHRPQKNPPLAPSLFIFRRGWRGLVCAAALLAFTGSVRAASYALKNGITAGWSSTTSWTAGVVPTLVAGDIVTRTTGTGNNTTLDVSVVLGEIYANNAVSAGAMTIVAGAGTLTLDNTGSAVNNPDGNLNSFIGTGSAGNNGMSLNLQPNIIIDNTDLDIAQLNTGAPATKKSMNIGVLGTSTITATAARTLNLVSSSSTASTAVGGFNINCSIGSSGGFITVSNIGVAATLPVTIAGVVGPNASITQNGVSSLILSNSANSYTGNTIITAGTLQLNTTNAIPSASSVTVDGTLNLNGNSVSINGLSGAATGIVDGTVALSTPTLTVGSSGGGGTFDGIIKNTAGTLALVKSGAGTEILTGANTYSGATTINAGVLALSGSGTLGNSSTLLTIKAGGTFDVSASSSTTFTLGSGGLKATGTGTTVGTTAATIVPNSIFDFNTQPVSLTWAGASSGTDTTHPALKATAGTLNFSGNTLTVLVPGAALTAGSYTLITAPAITGSVGSVPAYTGGNGVAAGYTGSLSISGNAVVLTVVAAGTTGIWNNGGANNNWSTTLNWSGGVPSLSGDTAIFGNVVGPVNLDSAKTVGALNFTNATSFTISGANTLTLNNSGSGAAVNVSGGTANVLGTAVSLADSSLGTSANVSSGKTLSISGNISSTSAAAKLNVTGTGTLALSGSNTYGPVTGGTVGTTLASTGTLRVGSSTALGAGDLSVTANGTLQAPTGAGGLTVNNNLVIGSGVTATADNNGNNFTLGGVISGSGVLVATGSGSLNPTNANNAYSGGTTINGGVLKVSAEGNLGAVPGAATGNNIILNGGDLQGSANNVTLNATRGIGIGATTGSATTTGLIDAASGQTFTVGGSIASAGNTGINNLTINSIAPSPGTVILGGSGTFGGTTVINGGTLTLSHSLALQNSLLNYNNLGGTLTFGSLTAATFGGLSGAQNLNLTDDSSAAVTLTVGGNNLPASYTGNLGGSGSLIKAGTNTMTIGSGASGGASYAGATTVNTGTLTLGGIGNMNATGNFSVTGNTIGNAVVAENAVVTTTGTVIIGNGNSIAPVQATVTVKDNASLTAAALSFGNGTGRIGAGSAVTVQDNASLTITGTANLNQALTGSSSASSTLLNLKGGTTTVGNFLATSGNAVKLSVITFNGGLLRAGANDPDGSTFLPALTGLTVIVTNGTAPAIIDSVGHNITIAASLLNTNGNSDAGLVKLGTGTLSLLGANTYNGLTTVSNGSLYISTALQSGVQNFVVNDGKGFGAVNNVGFQSAQIANLTLGHSSGPTTMTFRNVNDSTVPVIHATGTVTVNGTCNIRITNSFGVSPGTDYPLLKYSSLGGAGFAGLTLTLPSYLTGNLVNNVGNSSVDLHVTSVTYPSVTATASGNTLSLSWPAAYLGYHLQSQTNTLDVGITGTWFDDLGTAGVTSTNLTIDPNSPTVFYRLVYP